MVEIGETLSAPRYLLKSADYCEILASAAANGITPDLGNAVQTEIALAEWVANTTFADLPESAVAAMKLLTRTVLGTAVAGATSHGCEATVEQVKEWGGRPEATIWIYGGKAPAHAAAMANSVMARALDICDAAVPGQHIGTSAVPVGVATAELVGGVRGSELITALAIGSEIATRLGFVSRLDGFDPTGACSIFASCVTAAKILRLNAKQMLNAMALVFNKGGSSFQSNVDASLAVRLIEGFISQDGIICAQLAKRNITGPKNWVEGYGVTFTSSATMSATPQWSPASWASVGCCTRSATRPDPNAAQPFPAQMRYSHCSRNSPSSPMRSSASIFAWPPRGRAHWLDRSSSSGTIRR
jgi:2-methylcitrate dehydratase PrpD